MQNLNVTLVQVDQVWEDKFANYKKYTQLLKEVETDVIILPEMFHTGFSMNVKELAEDYSTSEGINWLKTIAHEKQAAIYTSLIIREDNQIYNRGVFVYPNGKVVNYDKRKSFGLAKEDQFYTAGEDEVIVEYLGWKIQLQICYDLRFPELIRNRIDSNQNPAYDVLIYVANWPEKRALHWNTLLRARAIENQCYTVGVNRIGTDKNKLAYSGNSKVVTALGEEISTKDHEETCLTVELNDELLKNTRKTLPFLIDR